MSQSHQGHHKQSVPSQPAGTISPLQTASTVTACQSPLSLQIPLQPASRPTITACQSHTTLQVPLQPVSTITACQSHLSLQAPLQPASTITNCDILAGCNVTWRQDVSPISACRQYNLPITPKSASPILATKSHFNLPVPSITTCQSHCHLPLSP